MINMISVDEAYELVMNHLWTQDIESIKLEYAQKRILAEDIVADRDLPPYDRVTMDGIALKFEEFRQGRRTFKIFSTVKAGDIPPSEIPAGTVCETMTGAMLPPDTDTIIRYEDLSIEGDSCKVLIDNIVQGQNIHFKGTDTAKGDVIVKKGSPINANIMAVAAACGYDTIKVAVQPKIAIFSSGDEIVPVNVTPGPQQIRQSNVYAMAGLLQSRGYIYEIFTVRDDRQDIEDQLTKIVEDFDVLIMTGGVSKGKFDFIPGVLDNLGVSKHFHRVAQRPGKPFWFGTHAQTIVFALPGNPVSTVACMVKYVCPWLDRSMGLLKNNTHPAVLLEGIEFSKPLTLYLQCNREIDDSGVIGVRPIRFNGSGDFVSLANADGFAELPAEGDHFKAGETVLFHPF